jgi:hypothetical protein
VKIFIDLAQEDVRTFANAGPSRATIALLPATIFGVGRGSRFKAPPKLPVGFL